MTVALVWTLVALVGTLVQLSTLLDSTDDREFARAMGWNGRIRLIGAAHVRSSWIRLYVVVGNVIVGVLVIFHGAEGWIRTVVAMHLILSEALLITSSYLDRQLRHRISKYGGKVLPTDQDFTLKKE